MTNQIVNLAELDEEGIEIQNESLLSGETRRKYERNA